MKTTSISVLTDVAYMALDELTWPEREFEPERYKEWLAWDRELEALAKELGIKSWLCTAPNSNYEAYETETLVESVRSQLLEFYDRDELDSRYISFRVESDSYEYDIADLTNNLEDDVDSIVQYIQERYGEWDSSWGYCQIADTHGFCCALVGVLED